MKIVLILVILLYLFVKRERRVHEMREKAMAITKMRARAAAKGGEEWEYHYNRLFSYPSWFRMIITLTWWKFEDFYPNLEENN